MEGIHRPPPNQEMGAEVYRAAGASGGGGPHFTLQALADLWKDAQPDGATKWRSSRGPLDAAVLSARRLGWEYQGPFALTNDTGQRIDLKVTPPKLFEQMLDDAVQRGLLAQAPQSLRRAGCEFEGKRVCVDQVQRMMAKKGARKDPGALAALTAVVGGTWTKDLAQKRGYIMEDTVCGLCGEEAGAAALELGVCGM